MTQDLDCKEVSRLISAGLDAEMPQEERVRLRLHLVLCQACRNVERQFSFLRRATRSMELPEEDSGRADRNKHPKP